MGEECKKKLPPAAKGLLCPLNDRWYLSPCQVNVNFPLEDFTAEKKNTSMQHLLLRSIKECIDLLSRADGVCSEKCFVNSVCDAFRRSPSNRLIVI